MTRLANALAASEPRPTRSRGRPSRLLAAARLLLLSCAIGTAIAVAALPAVTTAVPQVFG
ncbi:hypothetical protein [Actinokineospora enzanensis]|uniref:hypothetical protein n=1 Tax=Actinokineospora enzanensis TaxID=155975 RepID=UPI0003710285|nr:hypothetical protein [Actinokineospora enzanensis]